jgi:hypothetical protein
MTNVKNIIPAFGVTILLASGAAAQTSSRTFHLTTATSPTAVREIGTILRVLSAEQTSVNEESQTISVSGSPSDLALAAWLVEQLDSTGAKPAMLQYTVQGNPQSAVRIFYLSNTPRQAGLNEFVSTLRTVGGIQRIFAATPDHSIGIRTTEAQAQLAEWLVQQLDVTHAKAGAERYASAGPGGPQEIVEVAFLARQGTESDLNQAVTTLRKEAGIRYIFMRSSTPQGMAFRGSAEQVQSAEHLLAQINAQ